MLTRFEPTPGRSCMTLMLCSSRCSRGPIPLKVANVNYLEFIRF